jgi:hypothetical protein
MTLFLDSFQATPRLTELHLTARLLCPWHEAGAFDYQFATCTRWFGCIVALSEAHHPRRQEWSDDKEQRIFQRPDFVGLLTACFYDPFNNDGYRLRGT